MGIGDFFCGGILVPKFESKKGFNIDENDIFLQKSAGTHHLNHYLGEIIPKKPKKVLLVGMLKSSEC